MPGLRRTAQCTRLHGPSPMGVAERAASLMANQPLLSLTASEQREIADPTDWISERCSNGVEVISVLRGNQVESTTAIDRGSAAVDMRPFTFSAYISARLS